jgi:NADH-dependent peroxiredoxin subunit F
MLDADLRAQLQAYLQKLTRPVELIAALDDGDASRELRELLVELTQLSNKVSLREARGADDRVPSFAIASPGHDISLRFAGLPWGMNLRRWCSHCCRSAGIRRSSHPM